MKLFIPFLIILLINFIQSTTLNDTELIDDYIHMESKAENQTKMMSCLSIIHNSLVEGNEDLAKELKKKHEDPSKYFDKYVIVMLIKCLNTITKDQINAILTPQTFYGKLTIEDKNLIKITPDMVSNVNLTNEEQEMMNYFEEEIKVDYSKENSLPLSFWDKNLKTISIASVVVLVFLILFTLRSIFYDKKLISKYKDKED